MDKVYLVLTISIMEKIDFTKKGLAYEASFLSSGDVIVQIERVSGGGFSVSTNLTGMSPVIIHENPLASDRLIFQISVPNGMEVVLRSETEVKTANKETIS